MFRCELMKNGKCACSSKCAKLIWFEKGRADAIDELMDKLEQLLVENLIYQKAEDIAEQLKQNAR